ncbi:MULTISPECIES: hypothetical protein [Bacillus]|nr:MULTISPECIES: hypothetical protein [Bacillus subtilis group]MDE1421491.1 hypothetical protein [Bacillus licheniformis]MDQ9097881.1 hypothetical protein [Bacillus licheniformis]MEC0478141.1 hypothetical protein [Bacillus licheniformis]MEC0492568.1 hypothetical protein [Bacillus licheniformis]MEC5226269.1 hypothetical protein [Bacillus licheniformis]
MFESILGEVKNFILSESKNFALVLLSFFTVLYARKTYLATNTPRIVVKKIKHIRSRGKDPIFECNIKNYGKGIAVKTFLVLEFKEGLFKTTSFLSKPEVTIATDEERVIRIIFNTAKMKVNLRELSGFIISQDFSGGYYYVKLKSNKKINNQHLIEFDKPVRPINPFLNPFKFIKMKYSIRRAVKQGNTYIDSKGKEHRQLLEALNDEKFLEQLEQLEKKSQNT